MFHFRSRVSSIIPKIHTHTHIRTQHTLMQFVVVLGSFISKLKISIGSFYKKNEMLLKLAL